MRQRVREGHLISCLLWTLLVWICCPAGWSFPVQTRPAETTAPPQPPIIAPSPQRNPRVVTPAPPQVQIRSFRVSPSEIQAEVEQTVLAVATISSTNLSVPISAMLYRLDGAKPTSIGRLNDDGVNGDVTRRDGVYSAQVRLTERAGLIPLRVEVEQTSVRTAAGRVVSPTQNLRVRSVAPRLPTVEITRLNPDRINVASQGAIQVAARVDIAGFRVDRVEVLRDGMRMGTLKSVGKDRAFETFEATLQLPPLNPGTFSIVAVASVVPVTAESARPVNVSSRPRVLQVESASSPQVPTLTITGAQPRQVQQGVATDVIVTVALSQGPWVVRSGQLFEQNVRQPLATLQRSAGSALLTARFEVRRSTTGPIPLFARVELTSTAATAAQVLRTESAVFLLQTIPAPITQVRDKGLVLTIPQGFSRVDTKGANILMTNGPIERGGIAAAGVCLIEATRSMRPSLATRDLLASETEVQSDRIQTLRVAGRPAFRSTYREEVSPSRSLDYVAVYVESPNAIHKFFLSFLTNDAAGDGCRRSLDTVLGSARISE